MRKFFIFVTLYVVCLWALGPLQPPRPSVHSAHLLPDPSSGPTLTTPTHPKPQSITCGLPLHRICLAGKPHTPHTWARPKSGSRVYHSILNRTFLAGRAQGRGPHPRARCWQLDWADLGWQILGQRSESTLQGKGSRWSGEQWTPGIRSRHLLLPRGTNGRWDVHESLRFFTCTWLCVCVCMCGLPFSLYLLCEVHLFD